MRGSDVRTLLLFEGEWEIPRGERCFLPPPTYMQCVHDFEMRFCFSDSRRGYDLFSQKKSTEKILSVVFICENREGGWDGYFHRSNLDTEEWECASKEQGKVGSSERIVVMTTIFLQQ